MIADFALDRKYLPYLILAVIFPAMIPILPQIVYFQNPDVTLTILEFNNMEKNSSKISIILQNVGNGPAEKINLSIIPVDTFKITDLQRTDQSNIETVQTKNNLTLYIDRLAPKSSLVLQLSSVPISTSNKRILLAHDRDTENLPLNYIQGNSGITSMSSVKKVIPIGVSIISILIVSTTLRSLAVSRAESARRKFLGSLDVNRTKFWSKPFKASIIIIIAIHGLLFIVIVATSIGPPNTQFTLFGDLNLDRILESYNVPNNRPVNVEDWFVLAIMSSAFMCLLFSMTVAKIPVYHWFLKSSSYENLHIKDIQYSVMKPNKIELSLKGKEVLKQNEDVVILTNEAKVVGLLAKNEISKLDESLQNHTIRELLDTKKIDFPPIDTVTGIRNNFVCYNESESLDKIGEKMKKQRKRFALITNHSVEPVAILDYLLIFGEPDSLHDDIFEKTSTSSRNTKTSK